jgi:pyridoxamine---pyruvate transaminase
MREPAFTLTAGPVAASPRVLAALGSQITYDYDPIFLERFRATQRKVAELFRTEGDVVLMQGEAVLGLEAAARGLVSANSTCLNLISGVYSKWFGDWLRAIGATVIEHEVPFNSALDPADVEALLDAHPQIGVVSIVHCETPSGTINPIREIGPIVRAHDAIMICDVVASLCGNDVRVDEWGLDICVAGPQKCLASAPGLSLVAVSERAWEAIHANPTAPQRSYLSLLDWQTSWEAEGRFPYTPSVTDMTGLEAACDEVLEEGLDAVIARHENAARAARAGLRAGGVELWAASEECAAACVTAIAVPDGVDEAELRALVRDRYGVVISGSQGPLIGKVVRIGHMGIASTSMYPVIGVTAVVQALADLGVAVDVGAASAATLAALNERTSA